MKGIYNIVFFLINSHIWIWNTALKIYNSSIRPLRTIYYERPKKIKILKAKIYANQPMNLHHMYNARFHAHDSFCVFFIRYHKLSL